MNKLEFMRILERELLSIPAFERAEILSDFEEHFRIGLDNGKTEEQIAVELGDPLEIAQSYVEESRKKNNSYQYNASHSYSPDGAPTSSSYNATAVNYNNYSRSSNPVLKVLSIIGIAFLGITVVLPIAVAIIGALIGVSAIPIALIAAGIVLLINSIMNVTGVVLLGLIFISAGLILAAFSLAVLIIWLWIVIIRGITHLIKWITKKIKE